MDRTPPRPAGRARSIDLVLLALFLSALAAPPLVACFRGPDPATLLREKRSPNPWPGLPRDLASVSAFPARVEAWYDDRFGFRPELLRLQQRAMVAGFGVSPIPTAYLGLQGFVFYTGDRSVEVNRGLLPMTEAELETWRRTLEARRDWCAEQGIEYLWAIAPNKEQVYPELVPERLRPVGPTRLDQFAAWMRERSDVRIVDLRERLRAEKRYDAPDDTAYFHDDTHWSWRGAWAGYRVLVEEMRRTFPHLVPLEREGFTRERIPYASDVGRQLSLDDPGDEVVSFLPADLSRFRSLPPREGQSFVSESDDPSLPRVVMSHDSFGPFVQPVLAQNCSRLVCIPHYGVPRQEVLDEAPDFVIELHTERILVGVPAVTPQNAARISLAEFERLPALVAAPAECALPAGIEPRGTTQLLPLGDGACGELAVETREASDTFALPAVLLSRGERLAIRIEITSPVATCLDLWYRTRAEPELKRTNTSQVAIGAGRNELCFVLDVDAPIGSLLVRPGLVTGRYVLHRLELAKASL